MNLLAPQHLIPILIILLLLFGRGKISELMGDFAKGIKSFKKGLKDDDEEEEVEEEAPVVKKKAVKTIEAQPDEAVAAGPSKRKSTEKTSARRTAKRKA